MKRSIWIRIIVLVLVFSLLPVNTLAAGWGNAQSSWGNSRGSWIKNWGNNNSVNNSSVNNSWGKNWGSGFSWIWDLISGFGDKKPADDPTEAPTETPTETPTEDPTETPTEDPTETPSVPPVEEGNVEMSLEEGMGTVDNGSLLRGTTYSLLAKSGEEASEEASEEGSNNTKVVYFPITMYDYDDDVIRNATHKLEVEAGEDELWNGMYFSGGSPSATTYYTEDVGNITFDENNNALIPDGDYIIYSSGNGKYVKNNTAYSDWYTYTLTATANKAEAAVWTITKQTDGTYTIQDSTGKYMDIAGRNLANLSNNPVYMSIYKDSNGHTIVRKLNASNEYCYLNALGGSDGRFFGGWSAGSPITFAPIAEGITLEYAAHNFWAKKSGDNSNGDLIWTGLVQDTLVNDQIVFTVPEAGIFNNDTSVKNIYEYVGLPFVLNTTNGVYSFDSDVNGVYFAGTPQSGTAEKPHNLHFAEGAPQPMPDGLSVGDGSTNAFLPFNNQSSYATSQVDYHFGMRADLPFSMTPNGRVKSTDDKSDPITFTFSGDDDVWVFVDGHLVIDLGGIHNRLDVTIDFAANTITYSEENAQDGDNDTASFNNSDFAMMQQLFTADGVEGVIPMSREAFALDTEHEMQVFYLERGEGTSNCHIEFNLPMTDTVLVTKDATKSWSRSEEEANPDVEDAGVSQLTAAEQAIINNIDFGFTLYKKAAGDEKATPVANTNFYLIGRAVDGIVINQTDAKGHFYLKNGQSAKFITDIPMEGVTYYVVEDKVPDGFVAPDFNFAGAATYDYTYTDGTVTGNVPAADASKIPEQIIPMPENGVWAQNKSYEVTVKGSIESNDSIEFICSNFLDEELPNPTALAYEDIIVIDYGLPVNIDPLANDVFRGDSIEIIAFGGANMKLGEIVDKDKDKVFEESELDITRDDDNFHSGDVVLNNKIYSVDVNGNVTRDTFTYTLNKQLTEVEVITYIIKVTGQENQEVTEETLTQYDYAIGKVYIVPATTMYYEENFSDLVTFTNNSKTGNAWGRTVETDGASANQEPGVVGTIGDSTYGSDVAYLNDSFDSNGTSRYCDTTDGALQFSYTFTGTGTSIFARTSATTGYMQVKIYEGTEISDDTLMDLIYRDTYYYDTNEIGEDSTGTLYNIPVYTNEDLGYGTYTVVATIAKAGTKGAGAVGEDGYQHAGKDFYLDGIRIMQPLNMHVTGYTEDENAYPIYDAITEKALGAYATDGEDNIDTITLRQKLITDAETGDNAWNFVVLTDTNGEIKTAEEYTSIGPKEEVYLMPGQSISFAVKYWHNDGYLMHLGMKAPFGTAGARVGQNTFDLENATDCYYNITGMQSSVVTETDAGGKTYYVATYTITATDQIVSLTNLKVTGNYEFALIKGIDEEIDGSGGGDQTPDDGTGDESNDETGGYE